MAIPILPLPAGNTGLQALMGGFQQGIQNAGEIQKNRLNQLLTQAQATKNKYLEPQLRAAAQQQALRNQYLQNQVTEQPQLFQSQLAGARGRQALSAEQLKEMQGLYPAQQQKALLGNQLLQLQVSQGGKGALPQSNVGKYLYDYSQSVKTRGTNDPITQQLHQAYLNAVANAGKGAQTNLNFGAFQQLPDGTFAPTSGSSGAPTPASSGNVAGTTDGTNSYAVNPASAQSKTNNSANEIINTQTGQRTSVPTQPTATVSQKAILNARTADFGLENYFNNIQPELHGAANAPYQLGSETLMALGQPSNYPNYLAGTDIDKTALIDSILGARGLNKNKGLYNATAESLKIPRGATPVTMATKLGALAANISGQSQIYGNGLGGIGINSKTPIDIGSRQKLLTWALLNKQYPAAMAFAESGKIENTKYPSSFASQAEFNKWKSSLSPIERQAAIIHYSNGGK